MSSITLRAVVLRFAICPTLLSLYACTNSDRPAGANERPTPRFALDEEETTTTTAAPSRVPPAKEYLQQCKDNGITVPPGPIVTKPASTVGGTDEELGPGWTREKDVKKITLPSEPEGASGLIYTYKGEDGTKCTAMVRINVPAPDSDAAKNGVKALATVTGLICTNPKATAACFLQFYQDGTTKPLEEGMIKYQDVFDCMLCHTQNPYIQTPDLPAMPRAPDEGWKSVVPKYEDDKPIPRTLVPKLPVFKGCEESGCHKLGNAPIDVESCLTIYAPALGGDKPWMPKGADKSAGRPIIDKCCKILGDGSNFSGRRKDAYDALCPAKK